MLRPLDSTRSRTRMPETEIGEKAPAWAPLIVMMPMTSGLMRLRAANVMAAGAIRATAAGLKVPSEVRNAATRKKTQGISETFPRTARMHALTIRSIVPFCLAMPKKYVTPMTVRTMWLGKASRTSLSSKPR